MTWEPDALRRWSRRSPIRRSATCAARSSSSTRAGPTRRACTGATSSRCARSSRGSGRSPAATARSTRPAASRTWSSTRSWATTCRSRSTWSSAAGWRWRVREAQASEKMVPTIEGEFARKRRMMSHTWPIVLRGGMLSPRGYGPLYALMIVSHRILRYLTPFLHVIALIANIALLGQGWVYLVTLALQLAVLAARRARRGGAGEPLLDRPLLRADHRVAGRGAVGLARPRDGGGVGAGGGNAVTLDYARPSDLVVGVPRRSYSPRRSSPRWRSRSGSSRAGTRIYTQTRVGIDGAAVRDLQAAHDGPRRRVHRRRPGDRRRATTGSRGSATSCAATRSTSSRTCGTSCAARCRSSGRGRRSRCRSSSTPSASAAGSRSSRGSPAGRRSTAARRCRGPSGSSSTSGTSSTARCALDLRILARTVRMVFGGEGIYKGERGGWIHGRVAVLLTGVGQALRHRVRVRPARHRGRGRPEPAGAGAVRRPPPRARCRGSTTPSTCRRCARCATSSAWAR